MGISLFILNNVSKIVFLIGGGGGQKLAFYSSKYFFYFNLLKSKLKYKWTEQPHEVL